VAEAEGGVERRTVDGRLHYRNNICRFEFDYPDDGWTDFSIQDFSRSGCNVNLATPLVFDADEGKKITNAVGIAATRAAADFGRDEFQEAILGAVKKKGGKVTNADHPLLADAADATYVAEFGGTHYVGEVLTVRHGDRLYNIHFNATRGTVGEGRKHFLKFLGGLRMDPP